MTSCWKCDGDHSPMDCRKWPGWSHPPDRLPPHKRARPNDQTIREEPGAPQPSDNGGRGRIQARVAETNASRTPRGKKGGDRVVPQEPDIDQPGTGEVSRVQ